MTEQKFIDKMTGYKATDKDMQCRGFQFELGKWYEHDGEIELCGSGFHFCDHPSGPWAYYSDANTRIFKVEAKQVLETKVEPGADFKRVCRRIRLVEEVEVGGDRNNGSWNTGDRNNGNWNTGDRNTGNRNTGNRNTGYGNTGNRNTGDGNATNFSAGFFCIEEPKVICFDVQTDLTRDQFCESHPEYCQLCQALRDTHEIDFDQFKNLPGITPEKLKALHQKHLSKRSE